MIKNNNRWLSAMKDTYHLLDLSQESSDEEEIENALIRLEWVSEIVDYVQDSYCENTPNKYVLKIISPIGDAYFFVSLKEKRFTWSILSLDIVKNFDGQQWVILTLKEN